MQKRWEITRHNHQKARELAHELGVAPIVGALLISRGYQDAEAANAFLNPSLSQLHEPFLLKGLRPAVERILRAVENDEKILIWGDYDVDGTTGTAVLRRALQLIGARTVFYIPHRFTEGYGINTERLKQYQAEGCSLVVTVDTGIRSFEPLEWAQANGLDIIITDHHLPDGETGNPPAVAVINPNQEGCQYPDKNLAGVGVAFKLAHALLREKGKESLIKGFLKVVAIGTIADVMKLTGENRAIVALGLRDLPSARNHGLRALMEVASLSDEMTVYDIGFRIAPRINAAGRMEKAQYVIELLEAENAESARALAQKLDECNRVRQQVQKDIAEKALLEYEVKGASRRQKHIAVIAGENWHQGVIGLASSKVTDTLYRPSLVISIKNGEGKGSGRSIEGFHLLDALDSCRDLFTKYGGHAAACGFTLPRENIAELRRRINEYAAENMPDEILTPCVKIDANVSTRSLSLEFVEQIKCLEPFGCGNPKPIFATSGLILTEDPRVMREKHLRLNLADSEKRRFQAVWWDGVDKLGDRRLHRNMRVELAYTPEINTWNNNTNLQLKVADLRTAGT